VSVWWLLAGGWLVVAALVVVRTWLRLSAETDRAETALRTTVQLGERASDLRRSIEAARLDAGERRLRLSGRTASSLANRLHADPQ
jgi:hypothetical protein